MRRKKKNKPIARTDTSQKAKKVARKKQRVKIEKTMNAGTMHPQQFFNMLRQLLRKRSVYWLPILNTRNRQRIPYNGPNKRRKYSYICEGCGKAVGGTECNVHHKIPAGSLTKPEDLAGFIMRLFCEEIDLILLCHKCHDEQHEK